MKRTLQAAAAVALGTVLLAGCSGGSSNGSYGSGGRITDQQPRTNPGLPAPLQTTAPAGGGSAAGSARPSSSAVIGGTLIRTAQLTVAVSDARTLTSRADSAVDLAARVGGEVETDDRSSGRHATATLRLRVPPGELDPSLRTLSRSGRPSSRQVSSRDVTGQLADVTSRVSSAQRAIARLRVLYDGAARVSDIISIERELSSREADLESLQARQRALTGQTALATITLYLRVAPVAAKPATDDRTGFLGGLANGWDAFTAALAGFATGLGAALPFLVLLLILALAGRVTWRRTRNPAPTPVAE